MGKGFDETFLHIKSMIENQVSKHMPLYKQDKGCGSTPPWMNKTELDSIRNKHNSYKRYLKSKHDKDYAAYTEIQK